MSDKIIWDKENFDRYDRKYRDIIFKLEKEKQELIEEILNDMIFNGECYKMSIKNHEKWEERK